MLFDQASKPVDFLAAIAVAALQPHWIQPELGFMVVAFNMDMRGLAAVPCVEEKPVGPAAKHGRHASMLLGATFKSNPAQTCPIHFGFIIASYLFFISSGATSSLWEAMVQTWPKGSVRVPERSP